MRCKWVGWQMNWNVERAFNTHWTECCRGSGVVHQKILSPLRTWIQSTIQWLSYVNMVISEVLQYTYWTAPSWTCPPLLLLQDLYIRLHILSSAFSLKMVNALNAKTLEQLHYMKLNCESWKYTFVSFAHFIPIHERSWWLFLRIFVIITTYLMYIQNIAIFKYKILYWHRWQSDTYRAASSWHILFLLLK
jgi:hypothetical protein